MSQVWSSGWTSKTNQLGEVEEKAVVYAKEPEYCPIAALQAWLSLIDRQVSPLFVPIRKGQRATGDRLSDEWVNRLVQ